MNSFATILLLCLLQLASPAQSLVVNISGFRSSEGNVRLQFFDTAENFERKKPLCTKTVSKKAMLNGELVYTCNDLKPGTYGLAVLDDENANAKMDYGLLMPNEGFGFSDYYHTGLSSPQFESFRFILGSAPKTVRVKLRYL